MKNVLVFSGLFLAISLLSCQDSKDETQQDLELYKRIGTQIPVETGIRWMKTYNNQQSSTQGRIDGSEYAISDETLATLTSSVAELVGVVFHHALDENGAHHFLVIPIDPTLEVWSAYSEKVYVDANTNTAISRTTAQTWANNYKQANGGGIWFHFFGANIFDEIADIAYFNQIDIEPALNDLNLHPQVLLIVSIEEADNLLDGLLGGRAHTSSTVYDASTPCPPCPYN